MEAHPERLPEHQSMKRFKDVLLETPACDPDFFFLFFEVI